MHNFLCLCLQLLLLSLALTVSCVLGESAMVAFLVLQMLCANLLVLKLVVIFGLEVTACDAFAISALLCINLLREFYGSSHATRAILLTAFFGIIIATLFYLHNLWIPGPHDKMHISYQMLLQPVSSIFALSLLVSLITWFCDYALFTTLSQPFFTLSLSARMTISILISQALDTFLFTLWALGPWLFDFWLLFFWSYVVKILTTWLLVPLVLSFVHLLKKYKSFHSLYFNYASI
ncbi:MAG: queuosine precursor transporter [Pseudomonadota bacterium]|nr:queuosine precursor transporter [Pseudomonadota bacterium]